MFNELMGLSAEKKYHFQLRFFLQTLILFMLLLQISHAQGSWTKIGDMPFDRISHTINELDGKLYVVGGGDFEGGTFPATALVYDSSSQQWSQISLYNNTQRNNHSSCIVDGKLYVVGGNNGIRTTGTMEMYDPVTSEWIPRTPMPTDR